MTIRGATRLAMLAIMALAAYVLVMAQQFGVRSDLGPGPGFFPFMLGLLLAGLATVWLARDAHVVHYPVQANSAVAVGAVVDEPVPREGWGAEIARVSVEARLVTFAAELLEYLGGAKEWRAWSLFDPAPLPAWSRGAVGLIGDAAHPILPFLAQGGAMAIEDADALAALMAERGMAPAQIFARFEAQRRERVGRVQAASRENGRVFHLAGPERIARDLVLRCAPGSLMMRRYDWLYGAGT